MEILIFMGVIFCLLLNYYIDFPTYRMYQKIGEKVSLIKKHVNADCLNRFEKEKLQQIEDWHSFRHFNCYGAFHAVCLAYKTMDKRQRALVRIFSDFPEDIYKNHILILKIQKKLGA